MKTIYTDIAVVGAGPAGMCAAIEASKSGVKVILIDENRSPGGQLFKQIHKFFGSKEHNAGVRGFLIAQQLLKEVETHDVKLMLNTVVWGIFPGYRLGVTVESRYSAEIQAKKIIVCTGAAENTIAFPGSTLPGVIGAGAAQTLVNIYGVMPGKRVLMVGSGNVGLIVSYQLLQAGIKVSAIVEMMPRISGYMVHASKLRRLGVPIYVSTTVAEAQGKDTVEGAVIAALDDKGHIIHGTETRMDVDMICLAVGLRPLTEICWMAGCRFIYCAALSGHVPVHDNNMESSMRGIYVAGDISGIEEASVAMEEGRIAGVAAAESLGFIRMADAKKIKERSRERLLSLRSGMHCIKIAEAKNQLLSGGVQ
jgi:NADPH-dependent 2,4-dienoyl-CoA reductase/sulfur reductase-like enzyme